MPKDEPFTKVSDTVPDLYLMDFQLALRVVTNHILTDWQTKKGKLSTFVSCFVYAGVGASVLN